MNNYMILILSLTFILPACNRIKQPTENVEQPIASHDESKNEKEIETGLAFINAYVENCNKLNEAATVTDWVGNNKQLTRAFHEAFKKLVDQSIAADTETIFDSDPLFDAQDYPENGFELESYNETTGCLIVKGKGMSDFKLTMRVVIENNALLIDGCGTVNIPQDKRSAR